MNRGWRFCRPLPYHLATAPLEGIRWTRPTPHRTRRVWSNQQRQSSGEQPAFARATTTDGGAGLERRARSGVGDEAPSSCRLLTRLKISRARANGAERAAKRRHPQFRQLTRLRISLTRAAGTELAAKRQRSEGRQLGCRGPQRFKIGAGNGIRTRDFDLGKVALYH